ncbi:peptidase family M16-domain-containing protein [Flagelloscypha sp. PMI_526]|nr:peptidase family M16-domain-containing protein [Flagelloscypha sp. PMI_526]
MRHTIALRGLGRRGFATVVDSGSKTKIASIEVPTAKTASISIVVPAGSRYEARSGTAAALAASAFKTTATSSSLRTVRDAELHGGVLSTTLGRETLTYTAEFLQGDEAKFLDILVQTAFNVHFPRHDYQEYVLPALQAAWAHHTHDPVSLALEQAHQLAFRSSPLANSVFSSHGPHLEELGVAAFSIRTALSGNATFIYRGPAGFDTSAFTSAFEAVQTRVQRVVEREMQAVGVSQLPEHLVALSKTTPTVFGGSNRIQSSHGPQTVFVGFAAAGAPTPALATVAASLSPASHLKWTAHASAFAEGVPTGVEIKQVYSPYSDAALLGFTIQGSSVSGVKEAAKTVVSKLKATKVKPDQLTLAKTKAKFALAQQLDTRDGAVSHIGSKLLAGATSVPTADALFSEIDSVNAATFDKAASTLLGAKPIYVAVGDTAELPWEDEIGL